MKVLKLGYLFLILMGTTFGFGNELSEAIEKDNVNQVMELLNNGADVNLQDPEIGTPLMRASIKNHKDIVKILLNRGANVNLQYQAGSTALMWTSQKGHTDIVKILLKKGANVNLQNRLGFTALMSACQRGYVDTTRMLLEAGADLDLQNHNGQSILQLATNRFRYTYAQPYSCYLDIAKLLTSISNVESGLDKFENQVDEIKKILIKRWISLYKKYKDQQVLAKLRIIKDLAYKLPTTLPIQADILIRNSLASIDLSMMNIRGFEDVNIITES